MGRKKEIYIKTTSYVHRQDGSLVRLADLPKETREDVGRRLMAMYCNALYAGQAEFSATTNDKGEPN